MGCVLSAEGKCFGSEGNRFDPDGKCFRLEGRCLGPEGKRLAAKGSASAAEGRSSGTGCLIVRNVPCEQICLAQQVVLEWTRSKDLFCSRSVLHCAVFYAEPPRGYLLFLAVG